MLPDRDQRWSLEGLAEAAGAVLRAIPAATGRGDRRVNPVPDVRTLRYYQSVGLLDRPDNAFPRAGYYGYRHLLQVVATKALQASGLPLAQIQRGLTGRTVAELEAAIRPALSAVVPSTVVPSAPTPSTLAFPPSAPPSAPPRSPPTAATRMITVELAPGLLVTIDPAQHDVDRTIDLLARSLHPGVRP